MIALDTILLIRYLLADHPQQAEVACKLMAEFKSERHGFICREVSVELVWILDRVYGFSRNLIATGFEKLAENKEIHMETADDMVRAADGYRRGNLDFAEQMIAAAKRSRADTLFTFDRQDGQFRSTSLSSAAST